MNNNDIAILERIAQGVTAEEIGRCTKVYDRQTEQSIFLVQNSKGSTDTQGKLIEYTVRYSKAHGFTCTCLCGMYGFANCANYCWHVRASVATVIEEAKALAEIAHKIEEERKAAQPIEVKWNIPQWMLNAPVARHMRKAPKER